MTNKKLGTILSFLCTTIVLFPIHAVGVHAYDNPLDVPFKAQVLPGDWTHTNNCGQASSLMVFCYYDGTLPTEQGIKDIDDWLYNKYGDPVNNYNGSITDTVKLEALAREYGKFSESYKASNWDLNRLREEIDAGRPVIVAVTAGYLSNRGYGHSGGHFVVAKGYTNTEIICNDPGTSQGYDKYYANSEFRLAMADQGSAVVVVKSKYLTLQEAASQGLIELESKGGYFGDKVTFISGPNPENVIVKIRKGDAILNKDHPKQNLVASKDLEIFISAGQIVRLGGIWVACLDADRSPPYSGDKFDVTYNIDRWDVSSAQMLFRLLELIDEEELHEDWVAQDAVWKVTDNSPVESTRAKDLLIRAGIDPDADILDFPHLLDPNSSSPETGMVVPPELPIVSPPNLENLIVYPNPFRSAKHRQITFEGLTGDADIRIFTFSGELIYKAEITGQFNWKWNVKNMQGEKVARGIYFYLITDNNTGAKKRGKIAIIK